MKDYADSVYEISFVDQCKNNFARTELKKQTKVFDKLNKKYQRTCEAALQLKAKLEMQHSILRSL